MRSFAKHLIVSAALVSSASEADRGAAFPVTDTLRPHLATLMGKAGVRALFARALALATAEVSWLHAVQVSPDGDLEGWRRSAPCSIPLIFSKAESFCWPSCLDCWWPSSARV